MLYLSTSSCIYIDIRNYYDEKSDAYLILDENQYQQKAQGNVDHGGKVAKSTKESRR